MVLYRTDGKYGRGVVTIAQADGGAVKPDVIVARMRAYFTSPSYNPPLLPAVAMEVSQLARQSNVDMPSVIAVLEKDPLLAARVLKVAGSASSAPLGTIQSLRDAVVRIGLRNVADLAWEAALDVRMFRSSKYGAPMNAVRRHSTACAYLARLVAGFTSVATDYAFLCGLLHDVGMAAALAMLGEEPAASPLPAATTAEVLSACHEEASGVVAALWQLPADIRLVLANHHAVVVSGFVHPLTAIVAVAEQLARHFGLGVIIGEQNCDPTAGEVLRRARTSLQLDDKRMDTLRGQAETLIRSLPSLSSDAG